MASTSASRVNIPAHSQGTTATTAPMAARTAQLAGADVGADHGNQRRPQSEYDRDLQVLEACAYAVPGKSRRAVEADEAGGHADCGINQRRMRAGRHADSQNLDEVAPRGAPRSNRYQRGAAQHAPAEYPAAGEII